MKKAKTRYLILTIVFPVVSFYIIVWLYNLWFDTWDKIKYDRNYSPEFDQNKSTQNLIYWSVFVLCVILEIIFIKKYKNLKKERMKKL